ncbi:MAG: transferrin-binding protein-like solute binding protein [Cardiobacteriaceae bacterium]|nr:transferrin-binding protein-like solute binding protein [Cardiobacteriaceae bacterium]
MKTSLKLSALLASALLLTACGGSDNNNDASKDQPQGKPPVAGKISGHIQKPGGGHEPVKANDLDQTTYNGNIVVSLRKQDALMDMEKQPKERGGQDVDGDYLGIKLGNGMGGLHIYNDLSYARFGDISVYDTKNRTLTDTVGFFQGIPTEVLPASGVINYEGTAYQFGKTAAGKPISDYKGKLKAAADLSNAKINIKLSNVTVPIEANATIRGNMFIEHSVVPGRGLIGGFFGPNGAEIAGIVQQTNNGEWTATFGGKRE